MPEVIIKIPEEIREEKFGVKLMGQDIEQPAVRFTGDEEARLKEFLDRRERELVWRSPVLADIWKRAREANLFKTFGEIVKARLGGMTFGGEVPAPNQFGIKMLTPQDIRYVATPTATQPAYSSYALNTWELSLTAGTAVYFLGSAAAFYRANPVEDQRTYHLILALIERGTTPAINQLLYEGENMVAQPSSIQPFADVTVEKQEGIYTYELLGAIPVPWFYGIRLSGMPIYSGTREIRMLGVTFFERGYYTTLAWRA